MRNKSKNRYNTLHRLTSIVEEKDILAAKELMSSKDDDDVFADQKSEKWKKKWKSIEMLPYYTVLYYI